MTDAQITGLIALTFLLPLIGIGVFMARHYHKTTYGARRARRYR